MQKEVMSIKINAETYKPQQNMFLVPRHYRTVIRRVDEDGHFKWLRQKLEDIAHTYSENIEKVEDLFESVNCDFERLVELMNGETFTKWTSLDDMALAKIGILGNEAAYKTLRQTHGEVEI